VTTPRLLMFVAATLSACTVYFVMAGGIKAVFWLGMLISIGASGLIGFMVGRASK
jgi:hypothetical protein